MPDVLRMGAQQIIYYYYPRDVEDPDAVMAVTARQLRAHPVLGPSGPAGPRAR